MDVEDKKGKNRSFSLASSPTEDFLMISTKATDSGFKRKLISLKKGSEINAAGPFGNFIFDEKNKDVVMIAGGIGITPFRSMIKYVYDNNLKNKVTLIYSVRIPEDLIYAEEFDDINRENIKIIYTVTRPEESEVKWSGNIGRINEKLIKENSRKRSVFYICGPPRMVDDTVLMLKEMEVSIKKIKAERFVGY